MEQDELGLIVVFLRPLAPPVSQGVAERDRHPRSVRGEGKFLRPCAGISTGREQPTTSTFRPGMRRMMRPGSRTLAPMTVQTRAGSSDGSHLRGSSYQ
jgi:hypothetical protein